MVVLVKALEPKEEVTNVRRDEVVVVEIVIYALVDETT
jgi:hypothetical protein